MNYYLNYADIIINLMKAVPFVTVSDRFYSFTPRLPKSNIEIIAKDNFNPRFDYNQLYDLTQWLIDHNLVHINNIVYDNNPTSGARYVAEYVINGKLHISYAVTHVDICYKMYVNIIEDLETNFLKGA